MIGTRSYTNVDCIGNGLKSSLSVNKLRWSASSANDSSFCDSPKNSVKTKLKRAADAFPISMLVTQLTVQHDSSSDVTESNHDYHGKITGNHFNRQRYGIKHQSFRIRKRFSMQQKAVRISARQRFSSKQQQQQQSIPEISGTGTLTCTLFARNNYEELEAANEKAVSILLV